MYCVLISSEGDLKSTEPYAFAPMLAKDPHIDVCRLNQEYLAHKILPTGGISHPSTNAFTLIRTYWAAETHRNGLLP